MTKDYSSDTDSFGLLEGLCKFVRALEAATIEAQQQQRCREPQTDKTFYIHIDDADYKELEGVYQSLEEIDRRIESLRPVRKYEYVNTEYMWVCPDCGAYSDFFADDACNVCGFNRKLDPKIRWCWISVDWAQSVLAETTLSCEPMNSKPIYCKIPYRGGERMRIGTISY